ncbi:MAG: ABC transporter ATP-binding protein [Oscillibacter sp.]|nr:ABC transporter ATP-binding protein [Oscillibacter sp.]
MGEILLDVQELTHCFRLGRNRILRAVDGVSFQMQKGEIFGLVGESGSGKSTVARCIMNILSPTSGKIRYLGINTCDHRQFRSHKTLLETSRQIIFQDSTSSLNPRMTVADIIAEPMAIHHIRPSRGSLRAEAEFHLKCVGMDPGYLDKHPMELSGGQRQRVAIARALSMGPELLVADEPIASLDVSIQAQIINLFKHLQREHGFTFLFIAHDLAVVRYLCDRVGVMFQGKLVEVGPAKELFSNPLHPYTQALISAIPIPDPRRERARVLQNFDAVRFDRDGILTEVSPGHWVLRKGGGV